MAWRIHLTNQAIQFLHVLPGRPAVLAVWTRYDRVNFYNLDNGVLLSEYNIPHAPDAERRSERWQQFVGQLTGPERNQYLPYVQTAQGIVHATDDGKLRLYRLSDDRVFIETDGAEEVLQIVQAERFIAVALDRALGTIAALDERCQLHIYQQNIRVGTFDIGLQNDPDLRPAVSISRGGGSITATDGRRLVITDNAGTISKQLETHYYIGRLAISPGGGMVLTSDMENGVLRAYKSDKLTLTHQKFAIDLVAAANQVQLLADLPPTGTAISAMTAFNRGTIIFAMSGVVCVTDVSQFDELPRPKALL